MTKIKFVLVLVTGILFLLDYHICDYFYPNDLKAWWHLRHTIYSFEFLLFCFIAFIGSKGHIRFTLTILMVFILGDIWDRTIASTSKFIDSDYVLIIMSIIITILYLKNPKKCQKDLKYTQK